MSSLEPFNQVIFDDRGAAVKKQNAWLLRAVAGRFTVIHGCHGTWLETPKDPYLPILINFWIIIHKKQCFGPQRIKPYPQLHSDIYSVLHI